MKISAQIAADLLGVCACRSHDWHRQERSKPIDSAMRCKSTSTPSTARRPRHFEPQHEHERYRAIQICRDALPRSGLVVVVDRHREVVLAGSYLDVKHDVLDVDVTEFIDGVGDAAKER